MTAISLGQENYGNGSVKNDDRISGQAGVYRPAARRDSNAVLPITRPGEDLARRNGASSIDRGSSVLDAPAPIAASLPVPRAVEPTLVELAGPAFGDDVRHNGFNGSVADHPLLRGLMLELPAKGSAPQQEWMDRWFEAARSIMELIYAPERH